MLKINILYNERGHSLNLKRFKRPAVLALFLVVAIIVFGLLLINNMSNLSPYEYLWKTESEDRIAPSELLYQETLNTGVSLVFYISQRGKYECVLMSKTIYGYKILGHSGSLDTDNAGINLYGSFTNGDEKTDICWGILVDESIQKVFLDGEPCSIVDTAYKGLRIFWMVGCWEDPPLLTTNKFS